MQNPADASARLVIILFWSLFVVVWFATLGQRALLHPDEGRYAMLSLGMLQSGDWVTPRLNDILYFEKPALQYWAGATAFLIFGINEFAARFWPAATGLLSVLAVGLTARRLWRQERHVGQYAALVMGGSLWVVANSHFLNLDTGLMFFLTLTLCAFVWAQQDSATAAEKRNGMWLAWAAMAGATLSKGLIGLVIPAGTLCVYSLLCWDWRPWRRMRWLSGGALFLALTAPWFWLVSQRNPGFARFFFIHEHFERFLTTTHGREAPFWYFVPILLIGFLPWTSLLPRLAWENWPHRTRSGNFNSERFLLIWAAFTFLFFSKSGSKLPSYILPMFPALALLLGKTLAGATPASLKKHMALPVAVWALALCAWWLVDRLPPDEGTPASAYRHFALYLSLGGAAFLLCAGIGWRELKHSRKLPAIMLLAAGGLASTLLTSAGHDAIGRLKSSRDVVAQVGHCVTPEMAIFSVRTYDQTFPFYLQRPVIQVDYRDEFAFGQDAEPGKAMASLEEFIARWQSVPQAMAMMDEGTFNELQERGLAMQTVYRNVRRMVVVKP